MSAELPGTWMDKANLIGDVDFSGWQMRYPTDRYNLSTAE